MFPGRSARHRIITLLVGVPALGLAACTGWTDPATHIHAAGATLRFTGTADNGPAFSYVEYWRTADGPQSSLRTTTRTWPAGVSGSIGEAVTGLSASTSYTSRVCGADTMTDAIEATIDGGAGNDGLRGFMNREFIIGGPGNDFIFGYDGTDTINARDGEFDSIVTCGENGDASSDADIAYVDANGELPLQGSDCEDVRTTTPPPAP